MAVSLLCAAARPAFADGVSIDGLGTFFAMLAVAFIVALVLVIVLIRAVVIAIRSRGERRADPAVPEARVVARSKPS
jgi:type IV secretory pathway VirB3-like protein